MLRRVWLIGFAIAIGAALGPAIFSQSSREKPADVSMPRGLRTDAIRGNAEPPASVPRGSDSAWGAERAKPGTAKTNAPRDPEADLIKPLLEVWRIVFHNAKGQDVVLDCEVARSEKEKERGLMFRKSMPKNRGMIFVYRQPEEMNFWMQNTIIPLSIAYVHEKLFVSSIHDLKPFSMDIVSSETAVLYAIEANQGWFKSNAILPGNRMTIYKNPDEFKVERKNKYRKEIPAP